MPKYAMNEEMLLPIERDILTALRRADRKATEHALRWLLDIEQEGVA